MSVCFVRDQWYREWKRHADGYLLPELLQLICEYATDPSLMLNGIYYCDDDKLGRAFFTNNQENKIRVLCVEDVNRMKEEKRRGRGRGRGGSTQPIVTNRQNSFGVIEIGWSDYEVSWRGYLSWCSHYIQFHGLDAVYKFRPFPEVPPENIFSQWINIF
jgi:hypothetical protein